MKNNNGIFITAMRSGVTYSSFSRHSKLQHNIIVYSGQQISAICVYSSGGYRIFSQKQSSSEARVCIIFFFYCCRCSIVIAIFFSLFFFLSNFFPHFTLTHQHVYVCIHIKWNEATWFGHPLQLLYSSLSPILFAWYGAVWCCVIHCACRVLFRNSFIWGALITLHVRVRIKSNRYAHTNSCARIFYSLRDIKILLHWFLFISFESLALEL